GSISRLSNTKSHSVIKTRSISCRRPSPVRANSPRQLTCGNEWSLSVPLNTARSWGFGDKALPCPRSPSGPAFIQTVSDGSFAPLLGDWPSSNRRRSQASGLERACDGGFPFADGTHDESDLGRRGSARGDPGGGNDSAVAAGGLPPARGFPGQAPRTLGSPRS